MAKKKRKDTEAKKRRRAVKDLLDQCELGICRFSVGMARERARRERLRLRERSRISYVT